MNLKKNELSKLKADKEMQFRYEEGLDNTILKQRELIQKYESQKLKKNWWYK